jgi:thymidylate kinase
MIVELVGPPGAGKTTLAETLDRLVPPRGVPFLTFEEYRSLDREMGEAAIMKLDRWPFWRAIGPVCWRRPRLAFSLAVLTLLHGPPFKRRARKARRVLAQILFTERLIERLPDQVVVYHDGFTQCIWSMLIDSPRLRGRRLIRQMMRDFYGSLPLRVLVLEVDDTTVAKRVFGRTSKGRFNKDSSPLRRAEFGRWLDYYRELVGLLPENLASSRIDASSDPDALAAAALGILTGDSGEDQELPLVSSADSDSTLP